MADNWQRQGACTSKPLDLFFPVARAGAAEKAQTAEAIAVCRGCTVREQCLRDALEKDERFGVRAGINFETLTVSKRAELIAALEAVETAETVAA